MKSGLLHPTPFPTHCFPFTYKHLNHGFSQLSSVNEVSCPGRGGHSFLPWERRAQTGFLPMESSVSPAREQAEWHMLCWRLITTQPVGRQESPEEKLGSMLLGHFCSTAL